MNLKSQKRMAAEILKCGINRVKVTANEAVEEALTREDVRDLIRRGLITKTQKKGTGRAASKKRLKQKKKGRRSGRGRKSGRKGAKNPKKDAWMRRIRPIRRMLRELRDDKRIKKSDYRKLFMMVKGGAFRNKKHMFHYLQEHELLAEKKPETSKKKTSKKASSKKKTKKKKSKKKKSKFGKEKK